jgi:hypothetical protein
MTKRRWIIVAGGAVCAVVALAVIWSSVSSSSALAVTVDNRSEVPLKGLVLVSSGHRTTVPGVPAGESVTVEPRVGPGEDHLAMVDADGREYQLLGYFEGDPGGKVTVTVSRASGDGLAGHILDETVYFPAGESALEAQ